MTTKASAYIDEIDHLHAGEVFVRNEVPWDEYELLLTQLDGRRGVRTSYDRGSLEVVTLSAFHEMYARLIDRMIYLAAEKYGLDVESVGSMTIRKKSLLQGAEPDSSFYLQNASRIIGKRTVDVRVDPPPDLLVEIDLSHDSKRKHLFYEQLGVPEIWVYDEHRLCFYELTDSGYVETPNSKSFPILSSDVLQGFLQMSATEGQSSALRAFRNWLDLSI